MSEKQKKAYISKEEALKKLQRYCAYQDRCHYEVRSKLLKLGVYGLDLEEVMADLISDNFLNEERFARSYARGKFRLKHWGRNRIIRELNMRKISDYCQRKAMEEIEEEDYLETLQMVLEKKNRLLKVDNDYTRRQKLFQFLQQRGFETDLSWNAIRELLS